MKSLNQHVPTIVFVIGFCLLAFAMRTFFHPSVDPTLIPLPKQELPLPASEGDRLKNTSSLLLRAGHLAKPANRLESAQAVAKEKRRAADEFFAHTGLRMRIPDGYSFYQDSDGPVQVLVGSSEPGKRDFYFFATKGKYPAARGGQYLKDYFADEFVIKVNGKPQNFLNRSAYNEMIQFKAMTERGVEVQAFFFFDAKLNETCMLVLMNKNLSRQPARIKEIVDSLGRKA